MSGKQKSAPHDVESRKPLRVGSRVRCTDDGVEGRITWANALFVKIRWDDGEQVTWRRDSLAERPLAILDPPADEPDCLPDEPLQAPAPQPATGGTTTELPLAPEPPAAEPAPQSSEPLQAPASAPTTDPAAEEPPVEQPPADQPGAEAPPEQLPSEGAVPAEQRAEQVPVAQPGAESPQDEETAPVAAESTEVAEPDKDEQKRQRKEPKLKAEGKQKKRSALDAAAQVLAGARAPMNCQELIAAMAAQGLWSSDAGKTPSATLYSALLRELQTKGDQARFVKAQRGKFALREKGTPQ